MKPLAILHILIFDTLPLELVFSLITFFDATVSAVPNKALPTDNLKQTHKVK